MLKIQQLFCQKRVRKFYFFPRDPIALEKTARHLVLKVTNYFSFFCNSRLFEFFWIYLFLRSVWVPASCRTALALAGSEVWPWRKKRFLFIFDQQKTLLPRVLEIPAHHKCQKSKFETEKLICSVYFIVS